MLPSKRCIKARTSRQNYPAYEKVGAYKDNEQEYISEPSDESDCGTISRKSM